MGRGAVACAMLAAVLATTRASVCMGAIAVAMLVASAGLGVREAVAVATLGAFAATKTSVCMEAEAFARVAASATWGT